MAATPRGSLTVINCFPDSTFLSLEHFTKFQWKAFQKAEPNEANLGNAKILRAFGVVTPPF